MPDSSSKTLGMLIKMALIFKEVTKYITDEIDKFIRNMSGSPILPFEATTMYIM